MAFNFPDSPSLNDTSTQGSISYQWNGSSWTAQNSTVAFSDLTGKPTTLAGYGITDGVALSSLSATTNSPGGTGSLSYNVQSGAFSYTPPDLSSYLAGTDITVTTAPAAGNGQLAVDTAGNFTFTPADVSSKIALDALSVITVGTPLQLGSLSYSNITGVFTFTPPDIETNARSAISVGTPASPLQVGAIAYNSTSGVITYTPPDLSGYLTSVQASDLNAISIDALSDVDTASVAPTDGQALIWDNATGKWEPGDVASIGGGTDTLADITARGATTNDAVTINNTLTVTSLASTGLGFASLSSGSDISLSAAGDINVNSSNIINVTDPINAQDAATKNYVDTQVAGITSPNQNLDTTDDVDFNSVTLASILQMPVLTAQPASPTNGMVAVADGVNWDPVNSGKQTMVVRLGGFWVAAASAP